MIGTNSGDIPEVLRMMMYLLVLIAKHYNLTVEDCWRSAYRIIAARTGKVVNGVFIKD
jgi:hypothetical protein